MKRITAVTIALAALAPCTASAQVGTAPVVLNIPATPRAMSLGNAWITGNGAEMLFYNPSRLSYQSGSEISLARFGSNATFGTLATTTAVAGGFTAGFGARYLAYDVNGTPNGIGPTAGDLASPGTIAATSIAASFALQHDILGLRTGAAVQYLVERDATQPGDAVAWDVGITRDIGYVTVGLVGQNIGKHIAVGGAAQNIPTRVALGLTVDRIPVGAYIDITPAAVVSVDRDHTVRPGGGVDVSYVPVEGWVFTVRGGYRSLEQNVAGLPKRFTFGLGFALDRLALDYAVQSYGSAGLEHQIGIRVR